MAARFNAVLRVGVSKFRFWKNLFFIVYLLVIISDKLNVVYTLALYLHVHFKAKIIFCCTVPMDDDGNEMEQNGKLFSPFELLLSGRRLPGPFASPPIAPKVESFLGFCIPSFVFNQGISRGL